jgi:hypothetical protein
MGNPATVAIQRQRILTKKSSRDRVARGLLMAYRALVDDLDDLARPRGKKTP